MSCASCARFNRYMDCFRPLKDSPKFKWELNRNLIHVGSRKTRRTDMAKAATSKPKPFLATVTPVDISKGATVSGVRLTKMAGAPVADRQSVGQGKRASVRGDIGGGVNLYNNNK